MKASFVLPRFLAFPALILVLLTGCSSTDSGDVSVSGSVYYGAGFYDPWYYGPAYYPPSVIVAPPPPPPPRPVYPIAPRPTPMPSIPVRPMPRGR